MMLARLFSRIYKKNGIVLIDSQGQKYICGKPDLNKPVTLRLLKKNLNWKLILNPDLNFPEAYMRGEIKIENASLLDFMNMTFENIGRGEINAFGYFIKKVLHGWRYLSNYNFARDAAIKTGALRGEGNGQVCFLDGPFDPESGDLLLKFRQEWRSVYHPDFMRPLVNR